MDPFIELLPSFIVVLSICYPLLMILIMLIDWGKYIQVSESDTFQIFWHLERLLFIMAVLSLSIRIPKITNSLTLYLICSMIYALVLLRITARMELSFLFPVAGIMVFVAADFWELPVFVYGSLGNPLFQSWAGHWFDQIHRCYVLGLLAALMMLISWIPNKWSVGLLSLSVAAPFLILAFAPFPFWAEITRIITLICFGGAILKGIGECK